MRSIMINGFTGMNNVRDDSAMDENGVVTPRINLNADVTPDRSLKRRLGFQKMVNLPNAHSLWANRKMMLCAAEGYLYRIYPDYSKVQVCALAGPHDERLYYAEADGKIYISSRHWMGVFDPMSNTVESWGIPLPVGPMLSAGSGSLKAGTYMVCFTATNNATAYREISGNGEISAITLGDNSGIVIGNRPAGAIVWCTDTNGDTFYLAGEVDSITAYPSTEPLPTFMCQPPSPMRFIRLKFGRMWGSVGNRLYYTEPYRYGLVKSTNYFQYPDEIQMVAAVEGGIYVGFSDRTLFLNGQTPQEMREMHAGEGVVRGAVYYVRSAIGDLGENVPIWVAINGIVAGSHTGQAVTLTKDRLQIAPGEEGAAIIRVVNGLTQFMASVKQQRKRGSGVGFGDNATCEIVRNGKII